MKTKILLVILALAILCTCVSLSLAGQVGYSFRPEGGNGLQIRPGPPSSAMVAVDAVIGRPLGLATTMAAAGVFVIILLISLISSSVEETAWGLVGRPGGWTFVRPLGRGALQFEERGIFRP